MHAHSYSLPFQVSGFPRKPRNRALRSADETIISCQNDSLCDSNLNAHEPVEVLNQLLSFLVKISLSRRIEFTMPDHDYDAQLISPS